jgi:hypothetical protein
LLLVGFHLFQVLLGLLGSYGQPYLSQYSRAERSSAASLLLSSGYTPLST